MGVSNMHCLLKFLVLQAIKVYKLGAQKGLFLSEYQRSLYNVDTLTGRPWWKAEQTPYQTHLKVSTSSVHSSHSRYL